MHHYCTEESNKQHNQFCMEIKVLLNKTVEYRQEQSHHKYLCLQGVWIWKEVIRDIAHTNELYRENHYLNQYKDILLLLHCMYLFVLMTEVGLPCSNIFLTPPTNWPVLTDSRDGSVLKWPTLWFKELPLHFQKLTARAVKSGNPQARQWAVRADGVCLSFQCSA